MSASADASNPLVEESMGSIPMYNSVETKKDDKLGLSARLAVPPICLCILVVELCERLAFYTFTGTQEFFLEHLGFSLAEAGGLNSAMGTLCTVWALFAGWIADAVLGRYGAILAFGLVYVLGTLVAASAAWPSIESAWWYLAGVMILVPIGTAGIKANISNFGADQYDTSIPDQKAAQERFFSWFYLAINVGSAVAYGGLTTMGSNGGLGIPRSHGYFAVYVIAASCMLLAVTVFRAGRSHYIMRPMMERSPLGGVVRHLRLAASQGSMKAVSLFGGMMLLFSGIVLSVVQAFLTRSPAAHVLVAVAAGAVGAGIALVTLPCLKLDWLRSAVLPQESVTNSEVSSYLRLLPPLFAANLAFGALYNSMQFWYQQQACQMDVRMPWGHGGAQVAGSFFMIADCLGIVLATPIALGYLNPFMERRLMGNFGYRAKYGLGMVFGAASVLFAARLEVQRRQVPVLPDLSHCAPEGTHMSDLGATWMMWPFFLMGLGEIYTQPVLMHFAYSKSPPSMRTLTAATYLVIGSVSNTIFNVMISVLSRFVPDDLNRGHLEYGYYANLLLGALFFSLYVVVLGFFEDEHQASE